MSTSSKNEKQHLQGGDSESNSNVATSPSSGGSGHKASFRSANKLARRARSFKEDLLERISAMAMRSPGQQPSNRSHSPLSPKTRGQPKIDDPEVSPARDLEVLVRQVRFDLKHFCDVISKNKLEMLPGNGTIILDTITNMHTVIRPYVSPLGVSPSAALSSALSRLCQAIARLIRLCDEGMIGGEGCAALDSNNVEQITQEVHGAVEELANIAFEKMGVNTSQIKTNGATSDPKYLKLQVRPAAGSTPEGQRNSLPDIPLTPRERLILEGGVGGLNVVRSSHSTESILDSVATTPHHTDPPPKPPRPIRSLDIAPPLPPKKKIGENTSFLGLSGVDRVSLQSHSSGSLDSMLNTSNDDEIRAIMDRSSTHLEDEIIGSFNCASSDGFTHNMNNSNRLSIESSSTMGSSPANTNTTPTCSISNNTYYGQQHQISSGDASLATTVYGQSSPANNRLSGETTLHTNHNRFSNESGFVSMGARCSELSYTSFNSVSTQQQKTALTFIDATPTPQDVAPSITDFLSADKAPSPPPKTLGINMTNIVQQSTKQVSSTNYFEQNTQSKNCYSHSSIIKDTEQRMESLKIESSSFVKKNVSQTLVSSSVKSNLSDISDSVSDSYSSTPPALPAKTRRPKLQCDSLNDSLNTTMDDQAVEYRNHSACTLHGLDNFMQRPHTLMDHSSSSNQPPPLPLKKKHIMAYMEMFGNCSHPPQGNMEVFRHSVHTYNSVQHSGGHFIQAAQLQHLANSAQFSRGQENLSVTSLQQNGQIACLTVGQNGHPFTSAIKGQTFSNVAPPNGQLLTNITQNGQILMGNPAAFTHMSQSQTVHQFNLSSGVSSQQISINSSPSKSPHPLPDDSCTLPTILPPHTPSPPIPPSISPRESQYSSLPPALPPKRGKTIKSQSLANKPSSISGLSSPNSLCGTPTPTSVSVRGTSASPQPKFKFDIQPPQHSEDVVDDAILLNVGDEKWQSQQEEHVPNKPGKFPVEDLDLEIVNPPPPPPPAQGLNQNTGHRTTDGEHQTENEGELDLILEMDVSGYLIKKRTDEDGPEIRGGHPNALIVNAIKSTKDFSYQEAFLTTYRTFVTPLVLIEKLNRRHNMLSQHGKHTKAREVQAFLTRVVGDLTTADLDNEMLQVVMDFVYALVSSGDLAMAKALRVIIIDKYRNKMSLQQQQAYPVLLGVTTRRDSVLEQKSESVAEQMTLLDAELFTRIPAPEALLWARDQCEETSPNLTRFTEHFNKMSYWARSKILEQEDAKDREKYVMKFIKIMKHLRKMNNFNSYLALLSALDSAAIRRLEWQKHITDGLKEYCALIDSSLSFLAYRQALAETQPPCIPYIGLVLQDLTFVHIGNTDLLPCGAVNFSKRWQQYHILENMKRFSKAQYTFKKNERIIAMFNGFNDFINEEAMWQISESIKPRGGRKPVAT